MVALIYYSDNVDEYGDPAIFYRSGPKDLLAVFFYTLIMILSHAVIQEFILDASSISSRFLPQTITISMLLIL